MNWLTIIITSLAILLQTSNLYAKGLSLIRDAEIEEFLHQITLPIFEVANLDPDNINIYIVNDESLNAFVSGGQNIFINTGLITKYKDPNVLIGVLAHETGHISSGHLARSKEDIQKAGNAMLLSYIAGIAAAVTAGPDAGMALIMGGSQISQRTALKYNRSQEEAADYLALKYLNKLQYTPNGLVKLLEFFNKEESNSNRHIDQYALTHPVSQKRINFLKHNIKNQDQQQDALLPILQKRFKRIFVKLDSFLTDPDTILKLYNTNNTLDKYASCIAYYRKGEINKAIIIINNLIKDSPKDGYLYDLKGQILFENGNFQEAIAVYEDSIKYTDNNNLARIYLAKSLINTNSQDIERNHIAIDNLLISLQKEKFNLEVYKLLSEAYNNVKEYGKSYLALAELNLLKENKSKAIKYAKLAQKNLKESDKINQLRADDIIEFSKKIKEKSKAN